MENKAKEMLQSMENVPKDKEALIRELEHAEPEKMNWLMLNFLVQKMYDGVHDGNPDWQSERDIQEKRNRYSGGYHHRERMPEHYANRGYSYGRRETGVGQVYSAREHSGGSVEHAKESIAKVIGHSLTDEDLKCLICKEAASLIKRICKDEAYDAYKEFTELCIGMMAYSECMLSEEMEEAAKEDAIRKYAYMVNEAKDHHEFRSRMMTDGDYATRRQREGYDYRDHRGSLPVIDIDDHSYRGRSRDSMGRYK